MMRKWQACLAMFAVMTMSPLAAETFYPPASPHVVEDFNDGWRFLKADVTNGMAVGLEDGDWTPVTTPHTYNDQDSYQTLISHSAGDRGAWSGIVWYRKHFTLPVGAPGGKVLLEVEGLKQAGRFWVNGKYAGKYENGVTPVGLDLTGLVQAGENLIAVQVDNRNDYQEAGTGTEFEWMGRAFNPNYGGLNHALRLHVLGKVYQTLPLWENLRTTGIYVYGANYDFTNDTCDVTVEAQVRNESGDQQSITLTAVVVDENGQVAAKFGSEASDLVDGETEGFKAAGRLTGAKFWSAAQPHLYKVYSELLVNDKIVDVQVVTTGFREVSFRGGAGTGGVYVNGRFTWLRGYAQRSADEWAGLGEAYPDWLHAYNAGLIRSTHANYVRWMHVAPQAVDVRAFDRAGIMEVCPAGDKEKDVTGRQWEQRVAVMRDTLIYFRNSPSILFWEAGNNSITPEHLREMVALRQELDPAGGRAMGCRTLNDEASTPVAEYFGVMIGQDPRTAELTNATELFRAYSWARRDRAPIIETEDFRDEAARRYWDDYSPPHYGFKPGPNDTYHWNSETFCLAAAVRYFAYERNCITNRDPQHARWSGYASIYWSDSNADGRQDSSEVCRVSGKVDAVRLPKEAYYVYRVMQSETPDLHIIGHWTYPAGTAKTVYVAANHCQTVALRVNGQLVGATNRACEFVDTYNGLNKDLGATGYIYAFPGVKYAAGTLAAAGTAGGKVVAQETLATAGPAARLRLTVQADPAGFAADGGDVALVDVEVVDAAGRRCPTDEGRVDFKLTGAGVWCGGYNSGRTNSVGALWLDTECGINRVAIRSTTTPGTITLTASRPGLVPATITMQTIHSQSPQYFSNNGL